MNAEQPINDQQPTPPSDENNGSAPDQQQPKPAHWTEQVNVNEIREQHERLLQEEREQRRRRWRNRR